MSAAFHSLVGYLGDCASVLGSPSVLSLTSLPGSLPALSLVELLGSLLDESLSLTSAMALRAALMSADFQFLFGCFGTR
jgi:hypothetical protein